MTEEPIMQDIPEGMNPMDMPAPMRVNVLINELLQMVDHMSHLRGLIDETMKELMESQMPAHVHDENCNHDEEEVDSDDS